MAFSARLTLHDANVLSALFDPEASSTPGRLNCHTDAMAKLAEVPGLDQVKETERNILLKIDAERPDEVDVRSAIVKLGDLISRYPEYASAYNNRAEARRLLSRMQGQEDDFYSTALVLTDLAKAIELATPQSPGTTISTSQRRVLSSAHTHRAFLFLQSSRSEIARTHMEVALNTSGLTQGSLEVIAGKDFTIGGKYGNKLAKQLAVQTNPYAKLCGSIVKEAIQKEMEDYRLSQPGLSI